MKYASQMSIAAGLLTGLMAVAGCSRSDVAPAPEPHAVQSADQLKARLDTATKIPVAEARDASLKEIARDAATSKQPDLCVTALGKISGADVRKSASDACVAALTDAGDKAGAEKARAAATR